MDYVAEARKNYTSFTKVAKVRAQINVFLVFLLIASIYIILLISIIDASHAAVYQGIVSTAACQIATTQEQAIMAQHNMTYGEIDCQGIPVPLEVSKFSPELNISLATQLQGESIEINRYESLLFSDIKNAGNMLEAAILMISLLLVVYTITLALKELLH
jgi:hypothetical protein